MAIEARVISAPKCSTSSDSPWRCFSMTQRAGGRRDEEVADTSSTQGRLCEVLVDTAESSQSILIVAKSITRMPMSHRREQYNHLEICCSVNQHPYQT